VVPSKGYTIRPPFPHHSKRSSSSLLQSVIRFPMPKPRPSPNPSSSSSTSVPQTSASIHEPKPIEKEDSNQSIRVTTLIAMPSSSRRRVLTHRKSSASSQCSASGSTLKGKQRESATWDEPSMCEGIPPVVFGVADFQLNWGTSPVQEQPVGEEKHEEIIERTTESSIS